MTTQRLITVYAHIKGTKTGVQRDNDVDIEGDGWNILIDDDIIKVISLQAHITNSSNQPIGPIDVSLEKILSKAVSYARCIYTFAFEAPTRWGFSSNLFEAIDGFFPSRNDLSTLAYLKDDEYKDTALKVFDDVCKSYDNETHRLLEYWRRGFELHQLSYDVESFLNFAKILEQLTDEPKAIKTAQYHRYWARSNKLYKNKPIAHRVAVLLSNYKFARVTDDTIQQLINLFYARNDLNIAHDKVSDGNETFSGVNILKPLITCLN